MTGEESKNCLIFDSVIVPCRIWETLLFVGNAPPAREWVKLESYAVRFIGPCWLVWLIHKFKIIVETIAPQKKDSKFEGLAALVTTGHNE